MTVDRTSELRSGADLRLTSCELYESGKLAAVEATLIGRFCPPLRPEDVQRCLVASVVRFRDAGVHAYLPLLIERAAARALDELVTCSPTERRSRGRASS